MITNLIEIRVHYTHSHIHCCRTERVREGGLGVDTRRFVTTSTRKNPEHFLYACILSLAKELVVHLRRLIRQQKKSNQSCILQTRYREPRFDRTKFLLRIWARATPKNFLNYFMQNIHIIRDFAHLYTLKHFVLFSVEAVYSLA